MKSPNPSKAEARYTIILFYKFFEVKNTKKLMKEQRKICESLNLKGRFLIATEGVNATLEGETKDINKYIRGMHAKRNFKNVVFKKSKGTGKGFTKLMVKVRPEVVTLGAGKFNVKKETAKSITPAELERLYKKDKDFVVLDLRNNFEIEVGQFERTIHPNIKNFRDLPSKIPKLKALKKKKIIIVCTGGIRCEKASCLLKREGFEDMYQLKDGIHAYMQKYPNKNFKGSLFVFDNRMVTPVVDVPKRVIMGKCVYCNKACEDFYNDDSTRPSTKVICCITCIKQHKNILRQAVSI
ncbi:MAG: rhodanese-like domain-containing protein [Patescibacteria group bacterium]